MTETAPPDNGQTQAAGAETTATFGESQYGERLSYAKPVWQDLWAMILFYVHVVVMIVLGIIGSGNDENFGTTPSPTTSTTIDLDFCPEPEWKGFGGLALGLGVALVVAGIVAGIWLKLLQLYAESIIKTLMYLQIFFWLVFAVWMYAEFGLGAAIVPIIIVLFLCLYTWCVWSRIPFAGACLAIASMVSTTYTGTIGFAFLSVAKLIIWYVIWVFAASSLTGDPSTFVVFLFLVSYFWGVQVCRNVSHTTSCGVTATWYFNKGVLMNPSRAAWKRCVTTSFGSICFGSLLVAILQAARAIIKSQARGACGCIAYCILMCIERLMRYFNRYAFAQVAIYGSSFMDSARATWDLFMSRGIVALINDDLSGLALFAGACIGGIISAIVAFFVTYGFYDPWLLYYSSSDDDTYSTTCETLDLALLFGILAAFFALLLAYFVISIVLLVVASGVVALFVCFSEDPAALKENRPEAYDKLTTTNEHMMQVATVGTATMEDGNNNNNTGAQAA